MSDGVHERTLFCQSYKRFDHFALEVSVCRFFELFWFEVGRAREEKRGHHMRPCSDLNENVTTGVWLCCQAIREFLSNKLLTNINFFPPDFNLIVAH